jgi:hypothetical protein
MNALVVAAESPLRLFSHLDLGDQAAHRRIPSGKVDAGCLADQAAPSVAPDEIFRPQRLAVGQVDVDAAVVLRHPRHLAAAMDRHPQFADPVGQYALDVALPQSEPVGVPGGKIADVQPEPGETCDLRQLALFQEPISDSALIEHLDGACVETTRARSDEDLAGAPLDNGDVDARQSQLAGQHQSGRPCSDDHHRMIGHCHSHFVPPRFKGFGRRF